MCSNLITLTCMGIGWVSWYNCNWHFLVNSSFLLLMPLFFLFTSSSSSSSKRDFLRRCMPSNRYENSCISNEYWLECVCYTYTLLPRYCGARDSMIKSEKDRPKMKKTGNLSSTTSIIIGWDVSETIVNSITSSILNHCNVDRTIITSIVIIILFTHIPQKYIHTYLIIRIYSIYGQILSLIN